jgi:hypothetical protein
MAPWPQRRNRRDYQFSVSIEYNGHGAVENSRRTANQLNSSAEQT